MIGKQKFKNKNRKIKTNPVKFKETDEEKKMKLHYIGTFKISRTQTLSSTVAKKQTNR